MLTDLRDSWMFFWLEPINIAGLFCMLAAACCTRKVILVLEAIDKLAQVSQVAYEASRTLVLGCDHTHSDVTEVLVASIYSSARVKPSS